MLALPLASTTIKESLTSTDTMQLDYLGPIIVNTDGTTQKIPNWSSMTEMEKEKTVRLITVRNKERTEALHIDNMTDLPNNICYLPS